VPGIDVLAAKGPPALKTGRLALWTLGIDPR